MNGVTGDGGSEEDNGEETGDSAKPFCKTAPTPISSPDAADEVELAVAAAEPDPDPEAAALTSLRPVNLLRICADSSPALNVLQCDTAFGLVGALPDPSAFNPNVACLLTSSILLIIILAPILEISS